MEDILKTLQELKAHVSILNKENADNKAKIFVLETRLSETEDRIKEIEGKNNRPLPRKVCDIKHNKSFQALKKKVLHLEQQQQQVLEANDKLKKVDKLQTVLSSTILKNVAVQERDEKVEWISCQLDSVNKAVKDLQVSASHTFSQMYKLSSQSFSVHKEFEGLKLSQSKKEELKTEEEEEDILFKSQGKIFHFYNGEWKERGIGVVKILKNRSNKSARILMRRDQILKLCCNHRIDSNLNLQSMANSDGKTWVWHAVDFSEDEAKMERLALRFQNSKIASDFKKVFDFCKIPSTTSSLSNPEVEQAGLL